MEDIHFDRICRTNRSEAYLISQGEEPIARIDLHFTQSVVYGVLIVEKQLEENDITELIGRVDDDIVWTADLPREDFVVSVYQGRELGMYSDPDLQDRDEEEIEEESGHGN